MIENDLTGSQISQSIIGIGININQEEFHSSAPNPVSLRQITQKETDRMEVLNSVLAHIIDLYSRIENRETDIITKIQEYYLKAQYRKEGYHPYCDAKGEFTAKLIRVEPDGHLILKDKTVLLENMLSKKLNTSFSCSSLQEPSTFLQWHDVLSIDTQIPPIIIGWDNVFMLLADRFIPVIKEMALPSMNSSGSPNGNKASVGF